MSYAIVYSSRTGNTARLAKALQEFLPEQECVYVGPPDPKALSADTLYVGFWTDKGTCDAGTAGFLPDLREQSVFLFGTAGFGGDDAYFARILDRVKKLLPAGVTVRGTFMCQGKMPQTVRMRYEVMDDSPQRTAMLENFDRALHHPDEEDIKQLLAAVTA